MIRVNEHVVLPTIFPDNTSQVWQLPPEVFCKGRLCKIIWDFENEAELVHLAQLKYLLSNEGIQCDLEIPYFPYARQDHPIRNDRCFALTPFIDLLNLLEFRTVTCFDPHFEQITKLIGFYPIQPIVEIKAAFEVNGYEQICYGDESAHLRYFRLFPKFPSGTAVKQRDPDSGKVEVISVRGNFKNKKVLIVDDICDGGSTFIQIAALLKKESTISIGLYVSHGIFSKGTQILRDAGIEHVYTKDGIVV